MLLVLSLLSPVLMAGLLAAAVRMERRLDGIPGGHREVPQAPERARRRRRAVLGVFRDEISTRPEDGHRHHLHRRRLDPVAVVSSVEPSAPKHRFVPSRRRLAHLPVVRRAREPVFASSRGEPFDERREDRTRRGAGNGFGPPG